MIPIRNQQAKTRTLTSLEAGFRWIHCYHPSRHFNEDNKIPAESDSDIVPVGSDWLKFDSKFSFKLLAHSPMIIQKSSKFYSEPVGRPTESYRARLVPERVKTDNGVCDKLPRLFLPNKLCRAPTGSCLTPTPSGFCNPLDIRPNARLEI